MITYDNFGEPETVDPEADYDTEFPRGTEPDFD